MSEIKIRTESRYHRVAVEIAHRIADGQFKEGERISSRSTLSVMFNVSPETARKAVAVLTDLGIMEMRHGSGVYVSSKKKAADFAGRYNEVRSIAELRSSMRESIANQQKELKRFSAILEELEKQTQKVDLAAAFSPFDIPITESCRFIGQSIGAMNLWHYTGATVVAIRRGSEYIISPGPFAEFQDGDTVYYVGDMLARQRMYAYLYDTEEKTD